MASNHPIPVQLFERGFTELVSVIPPNAPLTPGSKIQPSQRGKSPGRRNQFGTWGGYAWQKHQTMPADVRQWSQDGANIGLLGTHFPAVDIDCLDPWLSEEIASIAQRVLGPAPVRTGKAPKQLLLYRLEGAPFARMAVQVFPEGRGENKPSHLVEVLGALRQYLVYGTHPSGSTYRWNRPLESIDPLSLTPLSREKVEAFFGDLQAMLEALPGVEVERVGDGKIRDASNTGPQDALKAPSLEDLADAVELIPNGDEFFPSRDDYIRFGYAIKAAGQDDEEQAFNLFAAWAARSTSSRVEGNPDTVRSDWRKMNPPFSIGWSWIAEFARRFGFNAAATEFEADLTGGAVDAAVAAKDANEAPPYLSDKWLADKVIAEQADSLRFVPGEGKWYVWNNGRWEPDALMLAEHLVGEVLSKFGAHLSRQGVTPPEIKENTIQARRVASDYTRSSVRRMVESDPRIAMRPEAFDADPWLLNTPGGIVDLRNGSMLAHDASLLCSKQTKATPDFSASCPAWQKFLHETAGGDALMVKYMQRVAGYCLTGSTAAQSFWLIWGPGGNGKSVFLNVLAGLLGDYARTAPMDTFTASTTDRHPTELAMMMGARLVTASETQAGRRWDEARMKALTGSDPVTARFMRQDFFTYLPQFKLIFVGNHKPEIRDVDPAMKRRIHLVPFDKVPPQVDPELPVRLRHEWPAILAWMIQGCKHWITGGLRPPPSVLQATTDYFNEQDAIGRWMEECTKVADVFRTTEELFQSWAEWCGRNNEKYIGTTRRFTQALERKKIVRDRDAVTRRRGFRGLDVIVGDFG
jgi:putative DNA primase/helicase